MNRFLKYSILILFILVISNSCSTKKNTAISRFHHSLTTRFNILFNGSESFKAGVAKYEEAYVEDYSQVLPVFIYGDADIASSIKSNMERTINKSTKSIRMHSITKKPDKSTSPMSEKDKAFYAKNEYNIYIDDAYLLMGKAFFYQNDYTSATRIFKHVIKQYEEETKYLAYNWLVRTYVQEKDFREARKLLEFLDTEMEYPEDLKTELKLSHADFYLKQQKYTEATPYVFELLDLVRKKKDRLRLTYIYAQLKELDKDFMQASEYFRRVIKMNPPYEMTFNATLKRAALFSGNDSSVKEDLFKMLKDDKNKEYQDQIYFALGEYENRQGNLNQAIEYYIESASSTTSNTNQKGVTFLTLANIFFDQTKYVESQEYLDSAVNSLRKDYPGYIELARRNKYLSKLVNNLKIVSHQDSLQKVAKMPQKEREQFINKIIADLQAKEIKQQEEERAQQLERMSNQGMTSRNLGNQGGKWYFYNPSAKSFGEPEFKRRWGRRKLEDNWRRKNKQSTGFEEISETELTDDAIDAKKGLSNKTIEYYMVELPLTDSAIQASHKKIQKALYNAGEVYRNDLKDYEKALDIYTQLVERYPENKNKVAIYYGMYKVYELQKNIQKANVYKNIITRNYPETIYAKILTDPNYFKTFEKEELERKNYYKQTLDLYRKRDLSKVIERCDIAFKQYAKTIYIPKYAFLKAISMGENYGTTVLRNELEKIQSNYKNDPVAERAQQLLATLKEKELKDLNELDVEEEKPLSKKEETIKQIVTQHTLKEIEKIYSNNLTEEHVFVIISAKEMDVNQLKFNIINFNLDFFIQENYEVENKEFNEFANIIIVSKFKDAKKSEEYLRKFRSEKERIFKDLNTIEYKLFSISKTNLEKLVNEKIIRDYLLFYRKHYK